MSAPKKSRSRRTAAKKPAVQQRAKSRPLAITDAVKRQELASLQTSSFTDNQVALFGALARWSPAQFFARQQAAFWEGFMQNGSVGRARSGSGRPAAARSAKSRRSQRNSKRAH